MTFLNALNYMKDNLVSIIDVGQVNGLNMPLYLKNEFMFRRVEIFGKRFILVEFLINENITIDRIKHRKNKLNEYFETDGPIVFVFNQMNDYQRRRLIEERISFIILGKMIFILEIGTVYTERTSSKYTRQVKMKKDLMKPTTQALLLYLLRTQNFGSSMNEIAGEIFVSTMSISRAFNELVQFELIKLDYCEGGEKFSFNGSRKEVWNRALPFMSNPVIKTIIIDNDSITERQLDLLKLSGESALSRHTMLSAPSYEVFGIHKIEFKDKFESVNILPIMESDSVIVQIFNHTLSSEQGVLDELSTALVLIDETDERVKGEVDSMLEKYFGEEVTNGKK